MYFFSPMIFKALSRLANRFLSMPSLICSGSERGRIVMRYNHRSFSLSRVPRSYLHGPGGLSQCPPCRARGCARPPSQKQTLQRWCPGSEQDGPEALTQSPRCQSREVARPPTRQQSPQRCCQNKGSVKMKIQIKKN